MNKSKSASAFIRSQPATRSTKDVIAAGRAKGLVFGANYVHTVRSAARRTKIVRNAVAKEPIAKRKRVRGAKSKWAVKPKWEIVLEELASFRKPKGESFLTQRAAGPSRAEAMLLAVASEIGLAKAIGILKREHEPVLGALRAFEGAGPGRANV